MVNLFWDIYIRESSFRGLWARPTQTPQLPTLTHTHTDTHTPPHRHMYNATKEEAINAIKEGDSPVSMWYIDMHLRNHGDLTMQLGPMGPEFPLLKDRSFITRHLTTRGSCVFLIVTTHNLPESVLEDLQTRLSEYVTIPIASQLFVALPYESTPNDNGVYIQETRAWAEIVSTTDRFLSSIGDLSMVRSHRFPHPNTLMAYTVHQPAPTAPTPTARTARTVPTAPTPTARTRTERVCFFSFDKKKRLDVPWSPMPRTNDRSSLDGQFSISVESYTDVQVVHMSHRTFVAVAESVVQDLLALNQGLLIPCVCTRQMRECFPFMY